MYLGYLLAHIMSSGWLDSRLENFSLLLHDTSHACGTQTTSYIMLSVPGEQL
jgi:hypothetical protein